MSYFVFLWKKSLNCCLLLNGKTQRHGSLPSIVELCSLRGFKNLSTLFSEELAKDLNGLHLDQGQLLQYVHDLLIASPDYEHCPENTITVLNHLACCRSKFSSKKAQICKRQVYYLGFQLNQGTQCLMASRKQAVLDLDILRNWREL